MSALLVPSKHTVRLWGRRHRGEQNPIETKMWRVGSPFVVHLEGQHGIRFLDEGGVSDDCSSTEEDS